jgi:hypothetical protein
MQHHWPFRLFNFGPFSARFGELSEQLDTDTGGRIMPRHQVVGQNDDHSDTSGFLSSARHRMLRAGASNIRSARAGGYDRIGELLAPPFRSGE